MGPISLFKKQKSELAVILLTAVTFALAINLISSSIPFLGEYRSFSLIIGGILLLTSLYGINRVLWTGISKTIRIRGAVAFKKDGDEINKIEIYGYQFNNEFFEYLNGFLSENQAYKNLFMKTLDTGVQIHSSFEPDDINFHTIMNSVLELVYLKRLQYHISEYFINNEIDKNRITSLSRENLDSVVLKNRVLDLITRDMKERAPFIHNNDEKPTKGIVIFAHGQSGAIYERLDLELPPKSTLCRNHHGYLVIENKLFKITFRPRFEGYKPYVHPVLIDINKIYAPYLVSMSLDIQIKKTVFMSDSELEIYEWLDSFIDGFESFASKEDLMKRSNLELINLLRQKTVKKAQPIKPKS